MPEDVDVAEARYPETVEADQASLGELLSRYLRLLQQYYWVILLTCGITVLLAHVWTNRQTPEYRTSSKIVYHKRQGGELDSESIEMINTGGRFGFAQFWNTQREVFRSRWFARRVVENHGLKPALLGDGGDVSDESDESGASESDGEKDPMSRAVSRALSSTSVELVKQSRVAEISATSTDPELAEALANAMAEEYVAYTESLQNQGLRKITDWFDKYVAEKREKLETAQKELQEYQKEHNILSLSYDQRRKSVSEKLQSINSKLTDIENRLDARQARLAQAKKLRNSESGDYAASTNFLESESLREAIQKENDLEAELARLRSNYRARHPKVQSIKNELEATRENIQSEIRRSVSGLEQRIAALKDQKSALRKRRRKVKETVRKLNELGVEYRQLETRANNLQQLYDSVLKRSSKLEVSRSFQSTSIEILERAREPSQPFSPNMPLNLAVGIALGLLAGSGSIVLFDALDTTLKDPDEVAEITDRPNLAMLPHLDDKVLRGLETIGESPADTITHTAPTSSFAEGIKTLRTNLSFMSPDEPPKSIMVTSPGAREGKTLLATNMAIALAQSGLRTLIVDADLRRPRLHRSLGSDAESGLSELVTGEGDVSDFAVATFADNLDALVAGEVPPNPSELLHSKRFQEIVGQARSDYDRVLIDTPPVTAVSDPLIVSNFVDGVLLVLKIGETRRESLVRSVEQLDGVGANLMGNVVNEIEKGGLGYYGSYNYYRRYSHYGYDREEDESPTQLAS